MGPVRHDGPVTTSVIFVCWGNICRSPMAERMAEKAAAEAVLDLVITSAGVSDEETGHPIDDRAQQTLTALGCRVDDHRAHRITAEEIEDADLIVCAEEQHRQRILSMVPAAEDKVRLITDFVPGATPGSPVPDPWYGDQDGFTRTAETIERALPGILDLLR